MNQFEALAREIIAGWLTADRNFFLVIPPLNLGEVVFGHLRDAQFAKLAHGDAADQLAVAFCPYGVFTSADELVLRACQHWKVTPAPDRSYRWRLESAVAELRDRGLIPVLLLPEFHRIVLGLPEELGSVLRALNQSANLLCVAEVPRRWKTLIERWRDEGRSGLINSDFGQGYSTKLILGHSQEEIADLLTTRDLSKRRAEAIYEMTGGAHHWVDRLLAEAQEQRSPQAWSEILVESSEFTEGFLKYLDLGGGKINRDAIARHFLGIQALEDRKALSQHDWGDFLLDETGRLRSSVVGSGCARHFSPHPSQSLEKIAKLLIRNGSYQQAWEVIERAGLAQGPPRCYYLIARILALVNSGGDEWSRVLQFLIELEKFCAGTVIIPAWKEFAASMRSACQSRQNANPDPIGHCCGRDGAALDPLNALRLIDIRLSWAEAMDSSLLATQTILTIPEALVQLYCAAKLRLHYWDPPPLDAPSLSEIRRLPQRANFDWPSADRPLSFNHLLTLGWVRMQGLPAADRLTDDYAGLDQLQQFYAQDRNPLSHRLTFSNQKQRQRYASECRRLFAKVVDLVVDPVRRANAALPPLLALLDAPSVLPPPDTQAPPAASAAELKAITAEDLRRILDLSHYLEAQTLPGGMSGSIVNLVEFRESTNAALRLGILKVTTKKTDFDRECQGSKNARASWLKDHVASYCKSAIHGASHYILSPLAFKAAGNRHIPSLHELLIEGNPQTREIFRLLGELYGSKLSVGQPEMGTLRAHFRRIWEHWREAAIGFPWDKLGFPDANVDLFADGRQNWVNPLACIEDEAKWSQQDLASFPWNWQHRDLNLRNVLVAPDTSQRTPGTPIFLFIDLEKVSRSSALIDLCWASLWALQAGSERASVPDATWDMLPDAFLRRSRRSLESAAVNSQEPDLCAFEYGVSCVSESLIALRRAGTSVGDPVILKNWFEITLGAAALAKTFYELRDLQRAKDAGERNLCNRWQRAQCFFRISARALAPLLKNPRGAPQVDLSSTPDWVATSARLSRLASSPP